jgi:hypothetical protein
MSFFSILSPAQYWVSSTDHEAPHYEVFSTPLLLVPLNPFQSRDAIWHHTFNSVLHFLGWKELTLSSPKKIVAYEGQN